MWGFQEGNWTPLAWLSHAFAYTAFGLEPRGHHLINPVLHGLNTLLVFGLTVQLSRFSQRPFARTALPPFSFQHLLAATLAAALFSVHPQHVESVAWVAERKGMLSALFTLLTVLSYCQYVISVQHKVRWYSTTLLLFALALMSKPVVTPLPLVLLCLDFYPLRRTEVFKCVLEKIPFLLLSVGVSVIAWLGQHSAGALADAGTLDTLTLMLSAISNTLFYFNKWLLPVLLSPFYPASEHYPNLYSWHTAVTLFGVFSLAFLVLYATWRGQRFWLVAGLSYLLLIAPVSGIVQFGLHSAADRFAYIPTLPFYLVAGIGLTYVWLQLSWIRRVLLSVGMALGISVLLILTQQQTLVWQSDVRLWTYVVQLKPDSWFAHRNLGLTYLRMGRYVEALPHLQFAAQTKPDVLLYLAEAYYLLGDYKIALMHYQQLLAIGAEFEEGQHWVHYSIAKTYQQLGETVAALTAVEQALAIQPSHDKSLALRMELSATQP